MTSISTSNAVNTTSIQFHGQPLVTAMISGVAYVAMRPIVENIGIDWSGQMAKLKNQRDKFGCRDISTPSKGGIQKMLCIPLRKLNGWLFSINPQRVRADIRDKLIQYQEECFAVLHEYWTKGEVTKKTKTRQSTATQLTPLRQTAERLITTGLGKIYPDIWKLVHDRFGIEHIHQLSPVQISEAVEYLNVLEGEYIGKRNPPIQAQYQLTEEELCDLCWLWKYNSAMIEAAYAVWPILHAAEHRLAGQYASFKTDYLQHARNTRKILERATSHVEWSMWRSDSWRVLGTIRNNN